MDHHNHMNHQHHEGAGHRSGHGHHGGGHISDRELEAADPEPWGGHAHEGMMMYFHGGYNEVILFDSWRIDSVGGLVGSMFACFVMGILYEGLKFARDHVLRTSGTFRQTQSAPTLRTPATGSTDGDETNPAAGAGDKPEEADPGQLEESMQQIQQPEPVRTVETSMFSVGHFILTLIHLVQVTLAYFLMLIVMTYNTWLCLAVVAGATVGYFLFGWRKNAIVDVSDHCH